MNELGAADDVIVEKNGLRLVSKLGQGGMAELFLGVQKGEQGFARLVVVKKIKAAKLSEQHLLGMFYDEAKTVAALSHPHIVKVFDLTRTDEGKGDVAIVMEYVDGETLSYVWKQLAKNQTHMPVPIVVKLMLDAAEALGAAHTATSPDGKAMQLIHRDVSPQNLMLDRNGYLKVIDFGIAKSTQQTELTSPGGIKGKLSYLAPETFRTRDIDARVDVYGLGIVLWELLTLKPGIELQPDAPLQEVVDTVDQLRLAPPSTLWSDVPKELDEVVARATAAARDQRYASMDDFAAALRKAALKSGVSSSAGVKKWFLATFAHRLEKRRAIETDAFARAERAPAAKSGPLPAARVETTEHSAKHLAPPLDAKPPEPTPLTEVRTAQAASSSSKASSKVAAALATAAIVAGGLAVVLWPSPRPVGVGDAGAVVATAPPAPPSFAGVVDAGAAAGGDEPLPETEAPPPVEPATATAAATKKAATKPHATTTAALTTTPTTAPTTTPTMAPPATTSTAPTATAMTSTATTATTSTATTAPATTTPATTAPATTAPATTNAARKLYSGNGAWTGAQVLGQGCTKCHAVDARAKTRRQWERFFERDVHDRHARLDDVFSEGEQQRALQSLLLIVDGKAGNSSGVAGVR